MSVNRKKWPTASLRQQAYVLRKTGMTDAQILQKFIQDGKIQSTSVHSSHPITSRPSPGSDVKNDPGSSLDPILLKAGEYISKMKEAFNLEIPFRDMISYLKESDQIRGQDTSITKLEEVKINELILQAQNYQSNSSPSVSDESPFTNLSIPFSGSGTKGDNVSLRLASRGIKKDSQ